MSRSRKLFLLSGMCVLLAILGAYYYNSRNQPEIKLEIKQLTCANLIEGCSDNEITVQFDHAPKVLQPVNVVITSKDAVEVHASFAMPGMAMGLNRYRLTHANSTVWQADVTLPVCVQGRSDWQALIEIKTPIGLKRYQFSFKAER